MKNRLAPILLLFFLILLVWSGIKPHDYFTWALEVFPAVLGAGILGVTYKKFRFTNLVYLLIWLHAAVLLIGGHFTYAEVPFFDWLKDTFHLARNHYDRLGHFMQGFVPAIIAREILVRKSVVKKGPWLFFIVVCICLAISAAYELFEWGTAVISGTAADAFLGTQGDVWDTQKDMLFALIGACSSLLILSNKNDKLLKNI